MRAALPQPTRLWHRSQPREACNWPEAVSPQALCLHLNFSGEGRLHWPNQRPFLVRPMILLWTRGAARAERRASLNGHECLTLIYPDDWLAQTLHQVHADVPLERQVLVRMPFRAGVMHGRMLTQEDRAWAQARMAPHLCEQARLLLDGSRLTEFLVHELFGGEGQGNAPISRTERVARERIERAKAEMLRQLDQTPSLEMLAVVAGCSPHYLSRTFTQVEGVPLSLWLRRARMDRAAELIASGRCNVSEAALEVGYRSLSHFSQAFTEEKGVSPSRWVAHIDTLRSPPNVAREFLA